MKGNNGFLKSSAAQPLITSKQKGDHVNKFAKLLLFWTHGPGAIAPKLPEKVTTGLSSV